MIVIEEVSEFNEMLFQIQRLNNILAQCREKRLKGDLTGWKFELDCMYSELRYDIERLDNAKKSYGFLEEFKKIDKLILLAHKNISKERDFLYPLLKAKEELLRKVQQLSGKGTKYSDRRQGRLE